LGEQLGGRRCVRRPDELLLLLGQVGRMTSDEFGEGLRLHTLAVFFAEMALLANRVVLPDNLMFKEMNSHGGRIDDFGVVTIAAGRKHLRRIGVR
jgi:hypothetical protein